MSIYRTDLETVREMNYGWSEYPAYYRRSSLYGYQDYQTGWQSTTPACVSIAYFHTGD